jgi:hypothetical protein
LLPLASKRLHLAALAALFAVLGSQLAWVKPTNFYGFDEWTVLSLLSRGIVDIPYANRPLELIWGAPGAWLAPYSFQPWAVLYWIYAWLSGFLVYLVGRRIAPARPFLALLAGVFAIAWAPTDYARLSAVERLLYGGITLGMLLAIALYLESWLRRSVFLLALSLAACVVAGRSYEGTLPVLLLAPALLLFRREQAARPLRAWVLAWEATVALTLWLALWPALFPSDDPSYQAGFELDLSAWRVLRRIALQYWLHLGPLVTTPAHELLAGAIAIAIAVFLAAAFLWGRAAPADEPATTRLAPLMLLGFALAGAGYSALALTERGSHSWRMQFLSAPGAALLLAALVSKLSDVAGPRRARAVAAVLSAWVIAVGTGRSVAMQRVLDAQSYYGPQTQLLRQLTAVAPDLEPHTLVVLLDQTGAWRADFGFRHAVELLYGSHASGYVWNVWEGMFPTAFGAEAVLCEPWSSIRSAWGALPSRHRYDEIVVVRAGRADGVSVLEVWPSELPPLPPGARYEPRARIRALSAPIAARRALDSLQAR